jgi:hypothetical protein
MRVAHGSPAGPNKLCPLPAPAGYSSLGTVSSPVQDGGYRADLPPPVVSSGSSYGLTAFAVASAKIPVTIGVFSHMKSTAECQSGLYSLTCCLIALVYAKSGEDLWGFRGLACQMMRFD